MPKVIVSPSKVWPGTVTLSQPLTLPQVAAYDRAMRQAVQIAPVGTPTLFEWFEAILPAVYACVESWELKDFPGAKAMALFPGQPRQAAAELADWLLGELRQIVNEAEEPAPKDSSAPRTPLPAAAEAGDAES